MVDAGFSSAAPVLLLLLLLLLLACGVAATSAAGTPGGSVGLGGRPLVEAPPSAYDFSDAVAVLEAAIADGAMPGATLSILGPGGTELFRHAVGSYTYGVPPPENPGVVPRMDADKTIFDMASCTKVVATTSVAALLYQRGHLPLDTTVTSLLGPGFSAAGKGDITVLNCLLHNAGFPPDPTPYWYWYPQFGCPQTKAHTPPESFECRDRIFAALLKQTLINPIGAKYVYSDLSMITLMFATGAAIRDQNLVPASALRPDCLQSHGVAPADPARGRSDADVARDARQNAPSAAQCYFEAYVRTEVFEALQMPQTGYIQAAEHYPSTAPCENDTIYLHNTWQGRVSDRNAYSLGGISGHAGLFSRVPDLVTFMRAYMLPDTFGKNFLNTTTRNLFIKEYNHSQSSRALGWNTNDPTVFDEGWGLLCGNMSRTTYMHVGFTGTELCGDPERQLTTILLTNRVYPVSTNFKIENVRRAYNKAVVAEFDRVQLNYRLHSDDLNQVRGG